MPQKPLNLQERIFVKIRAIGLSNGQKHELCKALYGKSQVCLLNREQGLDLEAKLEACLEMTPEECMTALMPVSNEPIDNALVSTVSSKK